MEPKRASAALFTALTFSSLLCQDKRDTSRRAWAAAWVSCERGGRTRFDGSKIHEADFTQPVSNEEPLRQTAAWHLEDVYGAAAEQPAKYVRARPFLHQTRVRMYEDKCLRTLLMGPGWRNMEGYIHMVRQV